MLVCRCATSNRAGLPFLAERAHFESPCATAQGFGSQTSLEICGLVRSPDGWSPESRASSTGSAPTFVSVGVKFVARRFCGLPLRDRIGVSGRHPRRDPIPGAPGRDFDRAASRWTSSTTPMSISAPAVSAKNRTSPSLEVRGSLYPPRAAVPRAKRLNTPEPWKVFAADPEDLCQWRERLPPGYTGTRLLASL